MTELSLISPSRMGTEEPTTFQGNTACGGPQGATPSTTTTHSRSSTRLQSEFQDGHTMVALQGPTDTPVAPAQQEGVPKFQGPSRQFLLKGAVAPFIYSDSLLQREQKYYAYSDLLGF